MTSWLPESGRCIAELSDASNQFVVFARFLLSSLDSRRNLRWTYVKHTYAKHMRGSCAVVDTPQSAHSTQSSKSNRTRTHRSQSRAETSSHGPWGESGLAMSRKQEETMI